MHTQLIMPLVPEILSLFSFTPRDYVTVTKKRLKISASSLSSDTIASPSTKAPFTRYRFHFISDWVRQSDMKISPVYTMPFSFHSGLAFCLHDTVSPCTVMVSPYSVMLPLRILRSSPNGFEASRIDNEVPY